MKKYRITDTSFFENKVRVNDINLNHRMSPLKHIFSQFDYSLATVDKNYKLKIVGINKKTRKIDAYNRLVDKFPIV